MNCLHCNKQMYSYYDDELTAHVKLEIERHLAECPSCRFQYDLTRTENEVFKDTISIPALSPDFNERVMQAILPAQIQMLQDNALLMKEKRPLSRRTSLFLKSAIAVVLLALCVYVPGIISGDQNQQKLAQTNQLSNVTNVPVNESKIKVGGSDERKDVAVNNEISKKETVALNNIDSNYGKKESIGAGSTASPIIPENPSTPRTNHEAGRALRMPCKSAHLSVSSLHLKNIPEKYKLVNKANETDNQVDYSYQTVDGANTITIQLNNAPESIPPAETQDKAIEDTVKEPGTRALTSLAAPVAATVNSVNREIRVEDQTVSILLSGNLSNDELNAIADQIVISKDK